MSGFWDDVTNAWKSNLYKTFTGGAAPGTTERKQGDLQRQLQQSLLQSALNEAKKSTPNITPEQQLDLAVETGRRMNQLALDKDLAGLKLAGGTSLLDVLGQKTEIADRSYDNRLSSETASRKDLLNAEADQRLRLMGGTPVELERYLADSDAALARDYMAHAAQSQERGIKAQQDGSVWPFIGGLLATAASLLA